MTGESHVPVLLEETIEGLGFGRNASVVDATADGGGHLRTILRKLGPKGKLIGLDWDERMIAELQKELAWDRRVKLFHLNFSDVGKVAKSLRPDAILFDLGLSSLQLYASGRGFSFNAAEGLEMTFSAKTRPNAVEFLREVSEKELEEIIREYGEEPFAGRIARAIAAARKNKTIRTAQELGEIISRSVRRRGRIHPATKTFQALRIYLNRELENISRGLEGAWKILKPGGRIAVISYHSLEDRIVKKFFKEKANLKKGTLIFKKPLVPSREEVIKNPRSRSAKLRIIEKNK